MDIKIISNLYKLYIGFYLDSIIVLEKMETFAVIYFPHAKFPQNKML